MALLPWSLPQLLQCTGNKPEVCHKRYSPSPAPASDEPRSARWLELRLASGHQQEGQLQTHRLRRILTEGRHEIFRLPPSPSTVRGIGNASRPRPPLPRPPPLPLQHSHCH
eukprot:CAMPEP_0114553098 /NCGR_PEP_ID=MMETSP0114-20121206/7474_1 /TAXON_ID=31324 /ORGANISM="Goniomonas sp, Strain m" /LENGTH=110 /DNA_ID=CAMNT_0001738013 /DNA_START=86 /DNA_END=418 /DNA_ORIENTATION=-